MNILKHMEATFIGIALAALAASHFADATPGNPASRPDAISAAVATSGKVAVVRITARRLNPMEKKAELLASR